MMSASPTVVAAWFAAAAALATGLLAAAVSLRLARSVDEDRLIGAAAETLKARLAAYPRLWTITDVGPKPMGSQANDLYDAVEVKRDEMRRWYYAQGQGLLLGGDAQGLWHAIEQGLATKPNTTRIAVWSAMSLLRTELKRDLQVRGVERRSGWQTLRGPSTPTAVGAAARTKHDDSRKTQRADAERLIGRYDWPADLSGR